MKGDGIGHEIFRVVEAVLNKLIFAFDADIDYEFLEVGLTRYKQFGQTIPEDFINLVSSFDGAALGPLSTLNYPKDAINLSSMLRNKMTLYSNIRPIRTFPGISKLPDMDYIIVRENTEGFFADRSMYAGSGEFMPNSDMAFSVRKITKSACKRIINKGFELALERKSHVTLVHKSNTLKLSDGLFLEVGRAIASNFPSVTMDTMLIDACAAKLISNPSFFDIIVTTNLFGDILSDEAAALMGSLGMAPSLNCNDNFALAQSVHGSAPDITGKNIANPTAILSSLAMLLNWYAMKNNNIALNKIAKILDYSITQTITSHLIRTPDIKGKNTIDDYIKTIDMILSQQLVTSETT